MAFCFLMGWSNESSLCNNLGYLLLPDSWVCFSPDFLSMFEYLFSWGKKNNRLLENTVPPWTTPSTVKLAATTMSILQVGKLRQVDEITCLRKILLDKGIVECCQSLFNMAVAIRDPRDTLGLLHISNYLRRQEVSLWQEDLRTLVVQE